MEYGVLFYWPNIIGYLRIILVFVSWIFQMNPVVFIPLYSLSVGLDGVDGWFARRLGQTSRFGSWLDVMVDNLGRGMLWSLVWQLGWLVSAVEWCVFVCNHGIKGDQWKNSFNRSPPIIRAIMANGFRTPLGLWVVAGLHCLPLWLYGGQRGLLSNWLGMPHWAQTVGTVLLVAGRLLALIVEMWCVWRHVRHLSSGKEKADWRTAHPLRVYSMVTVVSLLLTYAGPHTHWTAVTQRCWIHSLLCHSSVAVPLSKCCWIIAKADGIIALGFFLLHSVITPDERLNDERWCENTVSIYTMHLCPDVLGTRNWHLYTESATYRSENVNAVSLNLKSQSLHSKYV